ncbi:MAG: undecaprenyldiphospho-muramoylpentapeptide beta-N-acetylglucosaminyltransferase [Elainellaceae cyanobacterium]
MAETKKLLVAASGTGGHLFPAIATVEQLSDYEIEWLGVPNRLETRLVPEQYPLHLVDLEGIQTALGLGGIRLFFRLLGSVRQVRRLLSQGKFDGVFTTGGYIAAPAIIAARSLGLPAILHESNALPGKVTRWLSPWCTTVALGFSAAAAHLPKAKAVCVGTPVRQAFQAHSDAPELPGLEIPADVPLIVVVGGSQGAVAVNQLVRQSLKTWLTEGIWVVHLTGDNDPDADAVNYSHYLHRPFYDHMAALLQRADLAISRAGAGTLVELAITQTPTILIPYPFAAEDHQTFNAAVFAAAGAAQVHQQADLDAQTLEQKVLALIQSPDRLKKMAMAAESLAVSDSAARLSQLIDEQLRNGSSRAARRGPKNGG